MFRNVWFQLHWFFGITAGVILALVGITGGMLSFEQEILRLINPGVLTVTPAGERLAPAELLQRAQTLSPGRTINALTLPARPTDPVTVNLASADPANRRGETRHLHPYSGEWLGAVRGEAFFRATMRLHRWLLLDDAFDNRALGRHIVGASTVLLILLSLSGLYLRWPRHPTSWRSWLTFSFRRKGRGFLWDMHAVLGTWVLLFYLLASLTGLYWSYNWYRGFLHEMSGVPMMQRGAARPAPAASEPSSTETPASIRPGQESDRQARTGAGRQPPATAENRLRIEGRNQSTDTAASVATVTDAQQLATVFTLFTQTATEGYSRVTLRPPQGGQTRWSLVYQDPAPPHERASNRMTIDAASQQIIEHDRYRDRPLNVRLMGSMLPLHSGSYFGTTGLLLMMIASLAMPLFTITGWMLYLQRRRNNRALRAARRDAQAAGHGGDNPWLIVHASQSGTAERLAWQTASALQQAGQAVRVKPLGQLQTSDLMACPRALFVVATFGEGEAPVSARPFLRQMQTLDLSGLRYGLLSLGDRQYSAFCAFGRQLEQWLRDSKAQPLFDTIEVDNGDAAALASWRQQVGKISGSSASKEDCADAWQEAPFQRWYLRRRVWLNPGSSGLPVYHLELEGPPGCRWQAGDLAEIAIDAPSLPQTNGADTETGSTPTDLPTGATANSGQPTLEIRQYSIASVPADRRLHLLVRQVRLPSGRTGRGSGWLTAGLALDGETALRIRTHAGFHAPQDDRPLILIGNGTGLAGLRGLMHERIQRGHRRNWLLFGERHAAHDYYYHSDIQRWQEQGYLARLDTVFSRDGDLHRYVQHRLQDQAAALCCWLNDGAVIQVCGGTAMEQGIEQVIIRVIGRHGLDALIAAGRYRCDTY